MYKKNIFIHIGGHKTGSSAIHYCLKKNFKNLLNQDFFYLDTYKNEDMHNFLNSYNEVERSHYINEIIHNIEKIDQNNIIISRGSLCGTIVNGYNDSEIFAQNLSRLKDQFNIKIIYFVRDPLPFLLSTFFQLKKLPNYLDLTIEQFLKNNRPDKFFYNTIYNYEKYFGKNLMIFNYSNVFKNDYKNFLLFFFKVINKDLIIEAQNLNVNNSLTENSHYIINNSMILLPDPHKVKALNILKLIDKSYQKIFRKKNENKIIYQKDKQKLLYDYQSKPIWNKLNHNYNININYNYSIKSPKKNLLINLTLFLFLFFIFGISKKNNLFKFYKSLFWSE